MSTNVGSKTWLAFGRDGATVRDSSRTFCPVILSDDPLMLRSCCEALAASAGLFRLLVVVSSQPIDKRDMALAVSPVRRAGVAVMTSRGAGFEWNYSVMNNHGVALAREYGGLRPDGQTVLVFLNDDVEVAAGQFGELHEGLIQVGGCVCGAKLVYPPERGPQYADRIQHVGVEPWRFGVGLHTGRGARAWAEPYRAERFREVWAVTGALLAITDATFTALGGFDEGYVVDAQDIDLCRRAVEKTQRPCLVAQWECSYHYEGWTTGDRSEPTNRWVLGSEQDRARFWARHRKEGVT